MIDVFWYSERKHQTRIRNTRMTYKHAYETTLIANEFNTVIVQQRHGSKQNNGDI
jgi:hypothetical protein